MTHFWRRRGHVGFEICFLFRLEPVDSIPEIGAFPFTGVGLGVYGACGELEEFGHLGRRRELVLAVHIPLLLKARVPAFDGLASSDHSFTHADYALTYSSWWAARREAIRDMR